jgi:hypothetical protein
MDNNKFESFDEFCLKLNEDEKGIIGSLIDKTASFVPRAMRFAKAKSIMKSYLNGFEKKSLSLIKHFEKNIGKVADTAEENFKKFKKDKLNSLMALDKIDQAVNMAIAYKKELASLKESELKKINAYVDKILDSYTAAIDKRIDNPGFILNVELSDKGKGKLKAKWVELSAIKKMEIDEKLMQLLANAGLSTVDDINAELESFIEEHRYSYGKAAVEIYIDSVVKIAPDQFKVTVFLRSPGNRYALNEKGLLIGDTEEQLSDVHSARLVKARDLVLSAYTLTINAKETSYIRPYVKLVKSVRPTYGNIENIEDMVKTSAANGATNTNNTPTRNTGIPTFNPLAP